MQRVVASGRQHQIGLAVAIEIDLHGEGVGAGQGGHAMAGALRSGGNARKASGCAVQKL